MRLIDDRLRVAASDLANFAACRHLTHLELAAAHRLVSLPVIADAEAEALGKRGREHEQNVLAGFRAEG